MSAAETREHVREATQGVLTNSAVVLASRISTWVLAIVMTVMLPRYLGPTGYGQLYFAISFTAIVTIIVEFGMNAFVTREISRAHHETTRYLVNAAIVKVLIWIATFAIIGIFLGFSNYPVETKLAVLLLSISVLFTSLSSLFVAVFQALDRMRWVAISSVAEKVVLTALGVAALLAGYHVVAVALVMLVSTVVGLVIDIYWFSRVRREIPVHEGWQGLEVSSLFVRAIPFFSVLLFGTIYFRVDVLILSYFKSAAVVGWYGAAYRLFEIANFFPDAFMFAFFPVLCRLSVRDDESLALATQKSLDLLMLIGIPMATGLFVLAPNIIGTLYGLEQYAPSIMPLRILALGTVFLYANASVVRLIVAVDRQARMAVTAAVAAVFNIGLNLLLIPRFGQNGAAAVTVATEMLVLTMNTAFLPRELVRQLSPITALKVAVAAAVMAVPLVLLGHLSLILLIPLGVVVYFMAITLLRVLPADDVAMVKAAIVGLKGA